MNIHLVILLSATIRLSAGHNEISPFCCIESVHWSSWTSCSVSCGSGMITRQRIDSDNFSIEKESRSCILKNCKSMHELDKMFSSWNAWSACSASCGAGSSRRRRKCQNWQDHCEEHQVISCTKGDCLPRKSCKWSVWGTWTPCSVTCGGGSRNRTRTCSNTKTVPRAQTIVDNSCSSERCPNESASWISWENWTTCSKSCGFGTRARLRQCKNGTPGEIGCQGKTAESEACYVDFLCIASWQGWGQWGGCSETCGEGTQTRTRECKSGSYTVCPGDSIQAASCSLRKCEIAYWSQWSTWSVCDVACGKGVSSRTRRCLNLDSWTHTCLGKKKQYKSCKTRKCNSFATWSQWGTWDKCSSPCGIGWRTRTRLCLKEMRPSDECKGAHRRDLRCQGKCLERYAWAAWSECSVTCGSGIQRRSRICLEEEKCDSGKEDEAEPCNLTSCSEVFRRCGQSGDERNVLNEYISGRVVRGDNAAVGAWPWQVMIVQKTPNAYQSLKQLRGGASLVNNKWVLTAAHIMFYDIQELLLVLGITKKPKKADTIPEYVRFATLYSSITHESANASSYDYDIALIRIGEIFVATTNGTLVRSSPSNEITFSQHIRPVCLPCISSYDGSSTATVQNGVETKPYKPFGCKIEGADLTSERKKSVVTGFGDLKPSIFHGDRSFLPNVLQQALLKILSRKQCEEGVKKIKSISRLSLARFTNRMICTQSATRRKIVDACRGDSGGPLIVKHSNPDGTSYWVQIGIVSWGLGCANTLDSGYTIPGYFTKTAALANWMLKVMNGQIE